MLIGFIGSPCSGKTTIATKLFTSLKEIGVKSELIVEHSRHYIADKRYKDRLGPNDPVVLTDEDQIQIYSGQLYTEKVMKHSSGIDTIIISDSSAFNTALYMEGDFMSKPARPFFQNLKNHYDILFYCHPLDLSILPEDPNRIHDLESIKRLQNKVSQLLTIVKDMNINVKELIGTLTLEQRYLQASSSTMDLYTNLVQRS
jgi:nicotinamide riboside kinase